MHVCLATPEQTAVPSSTSVLLTHVSMGQHASVVLLHSRASALLDILVAYVTSTTVHPALAITAPAHTQQPRTRVLAMQATKGRRAHL